MKNRSKGTILIDNDYIESFKKNLTHFEPEEVKLLFVSKRIIEAIVAVSQGPQHEHYKYLKKDLNEHKILEYFIESILKNNVPSLVECKINYDSGIFEVFRVHGSIIKDATMTMLSQNLKILILQNQPNLTSFNEHDVFERYIFSLKIVNELISFVDQENMAALITLRNKLIDEICLLCNDLKLQLNHRKLPDGHYLVNIFNSLKKNYSMLASVWGELRLNFLYLDHYNYTVDYLKKVQEQAPTTDIHPAECDCKEHTI